MKSSLRSHITGFTLLELLVVIAIIGMLAAIVAPRFSERIGQSEIEVAKAQLDALGKALEMYKLDVGNVPTTSEGLAALNVVSGKTTRWKGPYLKKAIPIDPWGNPYMYSTPGRTGADFDLLSHGKDGRVGGVGENADILY